MTRVGVRNLPFSLLKLQRRWIEDSASSGSIPIRNLLHVQSCGNSEEVAVLVQPYIPSMKVPEISVVFGVLKRFPESPQKELMDALADQLSKQKTSIEARHVAQIFQASAKLSYYNTEMMEELAGLSMLPFQLEAFTHSDASKVLCSMGTLMRTLIARSRQEVKPKDEYYLESETKDNSIMDHQLRHLELFPSQNQLIEMLVRRFITITEYDNITAAHVSNALHGLAALGGVDQELVKAMVNMTIRGPIFREMTDQGLAGLLTSMGYLNHHDFQALDLITSEIVHPSRLTVFSERAMVTTIQGLSLLKYSDRSRIFQILTEAFRPWRLRKYTDWEFSSIWYHLCRLNIRDSSFLDLLIKEAMHPDRLQNCPLRLLFNILMSMSNIKYRNNDFLHAVILEIVSDRRKAMVNNKDYPAYVWILGQLEYNNPDDLKILMQTLLETNDLTQMPSKTLASIVYGLSKTSIHDQDCLERLLEELAKQERLEKMTEHSLSSLIHSLGKFPVQASPHVQAIVQEALKEDRLGAYTEYGLAAVVHGLIKLKNDERELLEPLLKEVQKPTRIDAYTPGTLSCLLLGLSSLGKQDHLVLVECLAQEIIKNKNLEVLEDSVLMGLMINFAEIHYENLDVVEKILDCILRRQELRKMTNANFSAFVFAIGELGYGNNPELILPLIDEISKRRIAFKNHEMSSMLYGLSQMGIKFRDFYTLKLLIWEALQPDRIAHYNLKELGRVYSALSLMEYTGKEMEPLIARIQKPEIFQNLDFESLAFAVFSVGTSGIKDDHFVSQLKAEMYNRGRTSEITEKSISQLIQGIGPLSTRKDYALGQLLLDLVHHHFAHDLESFSDHNLSAILYGLGQIGIENKVMIYPFIVESLKLRRLQKYSSKAISTVIFALGQFRFRDVKALLPLLNEVCRPHRIEQFRSRQLAGTIFSFCNMDLAREDLLTPLLRPITDLQYLKSWSAADLSMLFFTLVKIKPQEGVYLQNALDEVIRDERVKRLGDQEISAIIFSMHCLKKHHQKPEVLRALIDQLCVPGRLEKMNSETIGTIAYNLGRLEYCPNEFADILTQEAIKPNRLKQFSETALCNIVNILGRIKYENRQVMSTLMNEVMKPSRLPRYHEGHILNIVYALGSLRFSHGPFFGFMDRVLSDIREVDKFQPRTLLMIMVSYKLLAQGNETIVRNVSKSIFSNPKRLALLNDVQLSCLMNTLGEIQRSEKMQTSLESSNEEKEYLQ